MKIYKFLVYPLMTVLLMVGLTSCEDYLDINVDPNNPTAASPDLILPVAQNYTAAYIKEDRRTNHLGNLLMYNWSESQGYSWYDQEFLYAVTSTFYSQLFDHAYRDILKQYNLLTELAPEYNNYRAIGKIMKSYHYQLLVDMYGDVPYSEALGRRTNATPRYDAAVEIYDSLIVELTDAISLINTAADDDTSLEPGEDDIMFGGDMDAWKRFANTVKLRILVRQSDIASKQAFITSEIAAIEAEGSGYITDDVLINPGYILEEGKQSPLWDAFGKEVDGTETSNFRATSASQFILDFLESNDDPRIDYLYEEPETGHLGVDQGLEPGPEFSYEFVSNIGPGILKGPDQGANIFTLAESFFNQAEAALKGVGSGSAEDLYYNGIEASFDYLGAPGYEDYISQNTENVRFDASSDKLEAIITQKWIGVNGITAEQSWFDYSRTGFPVNLPVSAEASTPDRPVRLFYPASELATNAGNVPAQPNAFTEKLFWAQ